MQILFGIMKGSPLPSRHDIRPIDGGSFILWDASGRLKLLVEPHTFMSNEAQLEATAVLSLDTDFHIHDLRRLSSSICTAQAHETVSRTIREAQQRRTTVRYCSCPDHRQLPMARWVFSPLVASLACGDTIDCTVPSPSIQGMSEKLRLSGLAFRSVASDLERQGSFPRFFSHTWIMSWIQLNQPM